MYIDKDGKEHPHIFFQADETDNYLPGWYFEDETNCYGNDKPYDTIEKAEEALAYYFKKLNRGNNMDIEEIKNEGIATALKKEISSRLWIIRNKSEEASRENFRNFNSCMADINTAMHEINLLALELTKPSK